MPQYKNVVAAPYVHRFCDKWAPDLKYVEHSYMQAWWLMLSNLNQVGKHYYANGIQASADPEPEPEKVSIPEPAPEPEQDVSSDASPESDDVEHLHLD